MDLPKRTKQQRSEAHSYAVLLYKLRDLGIFRSLTDNDYGIDFELELVNNDQVTARVVKIQVKSAETLKFRADGTPAVGGIKQSTLNYWCELSYRTNVIAYAVDLKTETIYVSDSLFWQATKAIDGGASSKSIGFISAGKNGDSTAKVATVILALSPTAADHVYAHTAALRRLKSFLVLFGDAYHYDPGTQVDATTFRDLLEAARILLWGSQTDLWANKSDQKYWTSYEYWEKKSEKAGWDGLSCLAAQPILSTLVPALINSLKRYRTAVLGGRYYWAHRNPQFLALVYTTALPEDVDKDTLIRWGESHEENIGAGSYQASVFVREARLPKPKKAKKAGSTAKASVKVGKAAKASGKGKK